MPAEGASPAFTTTHWSVILKARGQSPQAEESLGRLCGTYWYPLYAFVRRRGCSKEEAEDLTQGFFARLLEGSFLANVHPEKGRFRNFLLASMKYFLANEWDRAQAQKRGGGCVIISLDAQAEDRYKLEPIERHTPETLFERRWALTVLELAFAQLRSEMQERVEWFDALKPVLMGDSAGESYAMLAQKLGSTEAAVKVAAHRLRQKFATTLRAVIAETTAGESEVEEELGHLIAALRT